MSHYTNLAEILEQAAKALRDADADLERVAAGDRRPVEGLVGYWEMCVRARRTLRRDRNGEKPLLTVSALCSTTANGILQRKNTGEHTLNEIRGMLAKNGLMLLGDVSTGGAP